MDEPSWSNWVASAASQGCSYLMENGELAMYTVSNGKLAVRSDHLEQLTVFPWGGDFHGTSTLPLMWSASLSVASQNFAYASFRHAQNSGYFLLKIAICGQPDNSLQYLFWQILCHGHL